MINQQQEQEIKNALTFYQEQIIEEGTYCSDYLNQEAIDDDINERAKDCLIDNIDGFDIVDTDGDVDCQKKEIIDYILLT